MATENSKQNKKIKKTSFEKQQHACNVIITVALVMSITWIASFSWKLVVAIAILFLVIAALDF